MRAKGTGSIVTRKSGGKTVYLARRRVNGNDVYADEARSTRLEAEQDLAAMLLARPKSTAKKSEIPTLAELAYMCQQGLRRKSVASSTHSTDEDIRLRLIEGQPVKLKKGAKTKSGDPDKMKPAVDAGVKLGKKRVDQIRREHLEEFFVAVLDCYSVSRAHRVRAFLSRVFTYAVNAKPRLIEESPLRGITLPAIPERDNVLFDEPAVHKTLNPSEATRTGQMVCVYMLTGFRNAEGRRLKWTDCDFDRDMILVPGTKNDEAKNWVPMAPQAKAAILAQPRRSEYVFTTSSGKPISARNFSRDFLAWKKANQIDPRVRIQDLRGTYGTMLIRARVDIKTTQSLMRHKDPRTTMRMYLRTDHAQKQEAYKRLQDFIASGSEQPEA